MRTLLTLCFSCFMINLGVWAQSLELKVTSSMGASLYDSGGMTLEHTLGEALIGSQFSSGYTLAIGFHQPLDRPELCAADLNGDGFFNTGDLVLLLGEMGCSSGCFYDINDDGVTNSGDLIIILALFGSACST